MYYDYHDGRARGWVQYISNFSDVLALVLAPPVESSKAMRSMWKTVARGPFVDNEDDRSDGDFFPKPSIQSNWQARGDLQVSIC